MSNHQIGLAMSLLGEDILELYEAGKISKEACISIIRSYINVAGEYDGNQSEAAESVAEAGYCGRCFGKYDALWDLVCNDEDLKGIDGVDIFRYCGHTLLHQYVCPECKAKLTREYLKLKKEKKF